MTNQLHAIGQDFQPNSIILNTKNTKEIAKFTEDGFYYKGEFIDDAGEVYRLFKDVMHEMRRNKWKDLCKELVDDLAWWLEGDCKPSDYSFEENASFQLLKRAQGELKLDESISGKD